MRYNIDSYEFDLIHAETKISTLAVDEFLLAGSEVGVLLWYGDLEAAKAGWRKQIEAHKQIHALVQKGERSWSEYFFELVKYSPLTLLSGMLAADEMGLVRERGVIEEPIRFSRFHHYRRRAINECIKLANIRHIRRGLLVSRLERC